jgi:ATP-dependent Lon protease
MTKIKNGIKKDEDSQNLFNIVMNKLENYREITENTIKHIHNSKHLEIISSNEFINYISSWLDIKQKINDLQKMDYGNITKTTIVSKLQDINNDISTIMKKCGTDTLSDLIKICVGDNKIIIDKESQDKWKLLLKYFHPVSYSIVNVKNECLVKKGDKKVTTPEENKNTIINNLIECLDVSSEFEEFKMLCYGIKTEIKISKDKKMVIYGILDDIYVTMINNKFIQSKIDLLIKNDNKIIDDNKLKSFTTFVHSLTIKDFLVKEDINSFYAAYNGIITHVASLRQKSIINIVRDFISDSLYTKRCILINLLIYSDIVENQYLAYLLYDIISNDNNGEIDNNEQLKLYNSLPYNIKQEFNNAMKYTVNYTTNLTDFDSKKIPLEQQICLMNVSDSVKEKAMIKYKEVKSKSEDGGSKARFYLEGLLKIPFNVYKKEPILNKINEIRNEVLVINNCKLFNTINCKDVLTNNDILILINRMKQIINDDKYNDTICKMIYKMFNSMHKSDILSYVNNVNEYINNRNMSLPDIETNKNRKEVVKNISKWIETCKKDDKIDELKKIFVDYLSVSNKYNIPKNELIEATKLTNQLVGKMTEISDYMKQVKKTLDECVHSHKHAKKQIELIIGQWINGTNNGIEACVLGFEGNPGIGKTTLAKGLSKCLVDHEGNTRPLSIIAIGGDANSSTLVGHSYTYVGSTWGQIVQILMDTKCMNPIIVIDEVDKISKTEHGREIVGVLTHLLDPTQNKHFQDKYFSGIELDVSKILFILSYNDVEAIDRVMLDRIHRIKFDSLSIEDKIIISKKHLLPALYEKFGLENTFEFSDEVLKFIIKEYTLEPGVRKLKEKLFEIIGQVNLDILSNHNVYELPIQITIDDIKQNYFKDKRNVKLHKIHTTSQVGVINALWANDLGQGGVLPLQVSFIPAGKFLDLTLTGSLGDVMKESIKVSLTNAWNLTNTSVQNELIKKYNNPSKNNVYGLHVHCPSISTKKDGPSATTAFTVILYSLFNNIKIKNYFGITGETSFDHVLTEIGGLREKIIHSIPSGITEFIYPKENEYDFQKIMDVYKDSDIIKGIKFHCIEKIEDVLDLILEK